MCILIYIAFTKYRLFRNITTTEVFHSNAIKLYMNFIYTQLCT